MFLLLFFISYIIYPQSKRDLVKINSIVKALVVKTFTRPCDQGEIKVDIAKSDLNGDGVDEFIVVFRADIDWRDCYGHRDCLVVIENAIHNYKYSNLVLLYECGKDCFIDSIKIKNLTNNKLNIKYISSERNYAEEPNEPHYKQTPHEVTCEWHSDFRTLVEVPNPSNFDATQYKSERGSSYIGDEVDVGYFRYKVNSIDFIKKVENSLTSHLADGIYLLVHMTVINTSRESRTLTNSMFQILDTDGVEFETSQDAMTVLVLNDQDKIFMVKEFPPKIPKQILMPFEVSSSNETYKLKLSGGFGTGKTDFITLTR
ncbi:MAG: DUF4352 domain-containing protein [Bacteroidetes bacterium]|nr:DUF4352 domain-containing protein [Bacteroidota bacterium]